MDRDSKDGMLEYRFMHDLKDDYVANDEDNIFDDDVMLNYFNGIDVNLGGKGSSLDPVIHPRAYHVAIDKLDPWNSASGGALLAMIRELGLTPHPTLHQHLQNDNLTQTL